MTGSTFFSFNGGFNFSNLFRRNSSKISKSKSSSERLPDSPIRILKLDTENAVISPITVRPISNTIRDSKSVQVRAPPHETLIVFDWDDTLFPTSWIISSFRNSKETARIAQMLTKEQQNRMRLLERRNLDLLKTAKSLGEVRIVTHASLLWVKESCESLMPSLYSYMINEGLMDVHLIACFDRYLYLTNKPYPKHMWKKIAFATMAKRLYENIPTYHPRSIVSIGDGAAEYQAAHYLKDALIKHKSPANCKVLKFVEDNPKLEALIKQVGYANELLQSLCDVSRSIDVHLHFDKNFNIRRKETFPAQLPELKTLVDKIMMKNHLKFDENGALVANSPRSSSNNRDGSHLRVLSCSPTRNINASSVDTVVSSGMVDASKNNSITNSNKPAVSSTEVAAKIFNLNQQSQQPTIQLPHINSLIKHQLPSESEEVEGLRLMGMSANGFSVPSPKSPQQQKDVEEVIASSDAIDSFHLERARQRASTPGDDSSTNIDSNYGVGGGGDSAVDDALPSHAHDHPHERARRESLPNILPSNPAALHDVMGRTSASDSKRSSPRRGSLPASSAMLESVVTLNKLDRFASSNNDSPPLPQHSISLPAMPLCPSFFPPPLAQRARQSIMKLGGGFSSFSSSSLSSFTAAATTTPPPISSASPSLVTATSLPGMGPGSYIQPLSSAGMSLHKASRTHSQFSNNNNNNNSSHNTSHLSLQGKSHFQTNNNSNSSYRQPAVTGGIHSGSRLTHLTSPPDQSVL